MNLFPLVTCQQETMPRSEAAPVIQSGLVAIASALAVITLLGCLTIILMQQSSTLSAFVSGFEAKWLYVGIGLSLAVGGASLSLIARLMCCSRRVLIEENKGSGNDQPSVRKEVNLIDKEQLAADMAALSKELPPNFYRTKDYPEENITLVVVGGELNPQFCPLGKTQERLVELGYSQCFNADELDQLAKELYPKRVFQPLQDLQFWKYTISSQGAVFKVYAYKRPEQNEVSFKIFLKDDQSIEEWLGQLNNDNFIDAEVPYRKSDVLSEAEVSLRGDQEAFKIFKAAPLPEGTFLQMNLNSLGGSETFAFAVKTSAGTVCYFKQLEDRERYIDQELNGFLDVAIFNTECEKLLKEYDVENHCPKVNDVYFCEMDIEDTHFYVLMIRGSREFYFQGWTSLKKCHEATLPNGIYGSSQGFNVVDDLDRTYFTALLDGSEVKKRDRCAIDFEKTQIGDDFYYCCDFEEGEPRTVFAYGLKANDCGSLYFSAPEARDHYIKTHLAQKKDLSFLMVTGEEVIEKNELVLHPLNFFPFKIEIDGEMFYALVLLDKSGKKHYLAWRTEEERRAALDQKEGLLEKGYVSAFEFSSYYVDILHKKTKILEEDYKAVETANLSPKQYKTVDIDNIYKEEPIFALVHGKQCRYFKKREYRDSETADLDKEGYYNVNKLRDAIFGSGGTVEKHSLSSLLVKPYNYVTAKQTMGNTEVLVLIYRAGPEGQERLRCQVFDSEDRLSELKEFLEKEKGKGHAFIEKGSID